ncbi:MAG: hypothetical protein BHV63_04465 [Alistipes sp. 56_11]|nr:MAG: hypothetical protein BHV63_04465 [Alistipes sp. 56_11]
MSSGFSIDTADLYFSSERRDFSSGWIVPAPAMHPPGQAITSTNWAIGFLTIAFSRAAFFLSSPSILVVV